MHPLPSSVRDCGLNQTAADAMPAVWRGYVGAVQFEQPWSSRCIGKHCSPRGDSSLESVRGWIVFDLQDVRWIICHSVRSV
jgi:hypothetical protein